LFSPVQGESYKMGSDESMSAALLEYSERLALLSIWTALIWDNIVSH
jgi:hypothetical protein